MISYQAHWLNGSLDFSSSPRLIPSDQFPVDYSYIADVVGNQGHYNPIDHRVIRTSLSNPSTGVKHYYNNGDVNLTPLDGGWIICTMPNSNFYEQIFPNVYSTADLSQWSFEAYNAFHDQIPSTVSLANFVYELKDLKGMIPKFSKAAGTKNLSSNFLGLEFGIKPFVGDLQKIFALSEYINQKIKSLKENIGKPVTLTFTRPLVQSGPVEQSWEMPGWNEGLSNSRTRWKLSSYKGTFRATTNLLQNLDIPDEPLSTLKAFAAAAGFNNPAAIVWEAIPYSFVVDWFFRFDQSLGSLAIQPFGGEWTLSETGYSTKESFFWDVTFDFFGVSTAFGTAVSTLYRRHRGLPMASVFLTDGSLTPKQLELGLALLNERR
jgi:hypothetical protein